MRAYKFALILLGVLSLVVLALPWLGTIAAVSVIGIPIAIAYWAIPAIFLVALIVYCLARLLPLPTPAALVGASILCGLILAVPPFVLNKVTEAEAVSQTLGDVDRLQIPHKVDVIGVVQRTFPTNRNNPRTTCDGFCLHALLSQTASEVLIANEVGRVVTFSTSQPATGYRLERRAQCPQVNFRSGSHELKLPPDASSGTRAASAEEIMKLEISQGNCLISRETTLADAQWVLQRGIIVEPDVNARSAGFNLTKSTVRADRLAVFERQEGGNFDEVYRWTGVTYNPLFPVLLPGPEFKSSLQMAFGWLRLEKTINIDDRYYQGPDWEEFLVKKLGFELMLDATRTREELPKTISRILSQNRAATRQEWTFIADYFGRLGMSKNTRMGEAEYDLAMRLLANPGFPSIPRLYNINRYLEKPANIARQGEFAGLLMTRLESGKTWPETLAIERGEDLRNVSIGFGGLPHEALYRLRERHLAISMKPEIRIDAHEVVTRLHVHGEAAVPVLLASMQAGLEGGEYFFRKNEFQHPYLGGLKGLCNGGARLATALPKLLEWSEAGRLPLHASYGDLLTTTVLRLGANEDTAWQIYKTDDTNRTRERFDRLARKARGIRDKCTY
jgi:hypothetical protein